MAATSRDMFAGFVRLAGNPRINLQLEAKGSDFRSSSEGRPLCSRWPGIRAPCRLGVTRDGGEPVAGPAMSVVPPKAVVQSGEWYLPRWTFADRWSHRARATTGCHVMPNARRCPATVDDRREDDACFIVRDNNGQGAPAGPFFQQFPRRWLLRRCRRHECSQSPDECN